MVSDFGELETPLSTEKDCAYVIFDGKTALCGIEQTYNQRDCRLEKPVFLSFVSYQNQRIFRFRGGELPQMAYLRWRLFVRTKFGSSVYQFVKEALVRKFGQQWFDELDKVKRVEK